MNTFYLIVLISIIEGFFIVYILAFQKLVFEIMNKENIDCTRNVDDVRDLKKIYAILKTSKNLTNFERGILWQHLTFTLIGLLLFLVLIYIMFFIGFS
jgi:hypothetical protein